jgi:hypothetical protein
MPPSLLQSDAKFEQQATYLVDDSRATHDPAFTHPVQRLHFRAHRKALEKRTDTLPDTGWHRINRRRDAQIAKQHGLHISEVYHILRCRNRSLPPSAIEELVIDDPEDIALSKEVLHLN